MTTKPSPTTEDCPTFDRYEIHCKLMALSAFLGSMHDWDNPSLSANECYGLELFLRDIAYMIDPSQQKEV